MIPLDNRIKYDDIRGCWRVVFGGATQPTEFKSSAEAYAHLKTLTHPPTAKQP
jgi:hypothetical protein